MINAVVGGGLATLLCVGVVAGPGDQDEPAAPTAGEVVETGVLSFAILDPAGEPIPARLTFIGAGGPGADLFVNPDAKPHDLAVRSNVVYSLSGEGRITVPVGSYTVYASHGLEWSIDSKKIRIEKGDEVAWTARLVHELDTTGWVSGDFHLHTLTYSGHGDANMNERIVSLVAEGVEFAVATDHNHHTDYNPTLVALGAHKAITAITGNEISTPIGHFNSFPLDPSRPPVDHRLRDADVLFKLVRREPNPFGVVPVIQINHPRWGGIDHFGLAGLDPVTAETNPDVWSDGFDSIEVFNRNPGWGYYDADVEPMSFVGAGRHSVLHDWFNLLNRGHRDAAVGNSDSHEVYATYAGYPRNFIRSSTDDPAAIDPAEIAAAIRSKSLFTTLGPFVEFEVDGHRMGETFTADDSRLRLHVRVRAVSWVDCDRVKVVINGAVVKVIEVPDRRDLTRLDTEVDLEVAADSWIVLLVEGDDSLAPIVHDGARPVLPLAVSNPVWVDADGDGKWTPPWQATVAWVERHGDDPKALLGGYEKRTPVERGLLVLAAVSASADPGPLIERALGDPDRRVRLCGVRAAERVGGVGGADFNDRLREIIDDDASDAYLGLSALRALKQTDGPGFEDHLIAFVDRFGPTGARRYGRELGALLSQRFVSDWMVVGFFPNDTPDALVTTAYGPETTEDLSATFAVKQGGVAGWQPAAARPSGFVELYSIDPRREIFEYAIAYARTWLYAPDDRTVLYTLGTDDGCQLFVNGYLVYTDNTRHGAYPLRHLGKLSLREGWNRVLIKVENGVQNFGLFFRVLDDEVTWSATKPS